MMTRLIMICVFLAMKLSLPAQEDLKSFVPSGYYSLYEGIAKGDLNKDGVEDLVLAIGGKWEQEEDWSNNDPEDSSLPQRKLIIFFGDKKGYKQVATGDNAILCKGCGGIFGDPFAGLEIKNGVLIVHHFGGSNWRWSYTHKFRYQQNDFFLIGQTYESFWIMKECESLKAFAGTQFKDENFITGAYEEKKISEDCQLLVNKKAKQEKEPLISLSKFRIAN